MEDKKDWREYIIKESDESLLVQHQRQIHDQILADIVKEIKLDKLEKLKKKL